MTQTAEKALALVNEVCGPTGISRYKALPSTIGTQVLLLAIERHAADMQRVSDAVQKYRDTDDDTDLLEFIIPKPVDPLVEALKDFSMSVSRGNEECAAADLRRYFAKHNLKIVPEEG